MEPFRDISRAGNEKAFRKGKTVPDGDINLAYFKSPDLTPEQNVVIVDTSRTIEANDSSLIGPQLFYANTLGVLEDANGNQVIPDEFPSVTDEFLGNEDFSQFPGSLYTPDMILPFVHVSRHFHLDYSGQTLGNDLLTFKSAYIKVVRGDGREYVDDNGNPRYKIKIISAVMNIPSPSYRQQAYRVFVFLDTDQDENLYLTYNKVEINTAGIPVNEAGNYRETVNPRPYFEYQPEESAVQDPENRQQKWYSTKPINLKQQILDVPSSNVDGYRVFVPKKAIPDPRVFQLFRWRVTCDFVQPYQVEADPGLPQNIRVGVITTVDLTQRFTPDGKSITPNPYFTQTQTLAPYAFLNLEQSGYNANSVRFINPLGELQGYPRQSILYWFVDFATVSAADLAQFDILIWAPPQKEFDFTPYLNKISYFVDTLGRTLFIDTSALSYAQGLNLPTLTSGVAPWSGTPITATPGPAVDPNHHTLIHSQLRTNAASMLIDGLNSVGGWEMGPEELQSVTYWQHVGAAVDHASMQYVDDPVNAAFWNEWVLAQSFDPTNDSRHHTYVLNHRSGAGGNLIFSTLGVLQTCNVIIDFATNTIASYNAGPLLFSGDIYLESINSSLVEGAMKLLYNAILLSVRSRTRNTSAPNQYSTSWQVSTPWLSSWTIDAGGGVLTSDEIAKYGFRYIPVDAATPFSVWQRQLGDTPIKTLVDNAMTNEMMALTAGAVRTYTIEVTNPRVSTPVTLGDNSFPYAWTTEYTPVFNVPAELGPYIMRDEEVVAQYDAGQFIYREYPSKPYAGQVRVSYIDTEQSYAPETVNWVATGTAVETYNITEHVPPSTSTTVSLVNMNWLSNGFKVAGGAPALQTRGSNPYKGVQQPFGLSMLQEGQYYASQWGNPQNNWIHYGLYGQWTIGSSGEVVQYVQWGLNRIQFWRPDLLSGPFLAIDGQYGSRTANKLRQFQTNIGARFIDGVVDAESLSLIGGQMVGLGRTVLNGINIGLQGTSSNDYTRFAQWAITLFADEQFMSDANPFTALCKRSWVVRGPSFIWDVFILNFPKPYALHGVTVTPYTEGATNTILLRGIDVQLGNINPYLYDPNHMLLPNLPFRPVNGQPFFVPFGPYFGNCVAVYLGQDGPAFAGSRMLGVKDISVLAEVPTTTVIPGYTKIVKQQRNVVITDHGKINLSGKTDWSFRASPHWSSKPGGQLSRITWTSVTTDAVNVRATIRSDGLITLQVDTVSHAINTQDPTQYEVGPYLGTPQPNGMAPYYAMDENEVFDPIPEQGQITKMEGLKLLCKGDKSPYGFDMPNGKLVPEGVGPNDTQRHYVAIRLIPYGNDASVRIGFYDLAQQEFVTNEAGEPEISFIDYMLRNGPNNIYIGVLSTYELDTSEPIPVSDDAPKLPYRKAMPIYGVSFTGEPRITLESVPGNLGVGDVWPVAVRDGQFDRIVQIPNQTTQPLTGWLAKYQNRRLHAFYGVPEIDSGGWSVLYGPPNVDVKNEEPIILDDNVIQIRQPAIHLQKMPTVYNTNADPVRPVFQLYSRATTESDWVPIPLTAIADWNTSTGEITLVNPLTSTDPALVRADYTSHRGNFYFKGFGSDILNLNPYPGTARSLVGQAIHIYIVPEYVKDEDFNVIPDSTTSRTINFTTNTNIFDRTRPEYNPLAVQLGVVYISPGLNIADLVLLDTRSRGGGILNTTSVEEIVRLTAEAATYWDVSYGTGLSYQKGGFVIIRLPAALKHNFSEQEITTVVERNVSAGVRYRIEDLNGNPWS